MKTIKFIWKYLYGKRRYYIGAILCMCLATGISLINPLVISFTLDSVIGGKEINLPGFLEKLITAVGGTDLFRRHLWICGFTLTFFSLINGVVSFFRGKWSATASESIARNFRENLYDHLQYLPFDEHVKAKTGDLIQRCTSDVDTVRRFFANQLVEMGRAIFLLITMSVIMFNINATLASVSIIVLPVIFVFAFLFFKKMQKLFLKADESEGRLSANIQENLTGVRVVKAFGRHKFEIDRFEEKNREYRKLNMDMMVLFSSYWAISDFICFLQTGTIAIVGTYLAATGKITLGTLIVFQTYIGMLLWPIRQTGRILSDMGKATVASGRIMEILNKPIEKYDDNAEKYPIHGNISFKNVKFSYDDKIVLDGITFDIKKGETVALMGPTGSGKTSLVNLLLRLYEYQEGKILIEGIEINKIDKKWLRQNMGIVSQEPFLYSKTIKDNIKMSMETDPNDEEVFTATRVASVHDVINGFEKGYDTLVGERGVTLSGGQKQRVTIARTVIKSYPVLIFDDSLSAVDTETDAQIRKALKERSREVTTILISHRVTTVCEADKIIVLDKGKISQMGTHNELLSQEGLYKKFWEIQGMLEADLEAELKEQEG